VEIRRASRILSPVARFTRRALTCASMNRG
jgi:hypothetical protein